MFFGFTSNIFILSFNIFGIIFTGKECYVGRYFLSEHHIFFHCFLALIISVEKSFVKVVPPLKVIFLFFCSGWFQIFFIFFLPLVISSFIMHLGMVFFAFILLGICDVSWIYRLVFSSLGEKYSISVQILYLLYSLTFLLLGLQLHIRWIF